MWIQVAEVIAGSLGYRRSLESRNTGGLCCRIGLINKLLEPRLELCLGVFDRLNLIASESDLSIINLAHEKAGDHAVERLMGTIDLEASSERAIGLEGGDPNIVDGIRTTKRAACGCAPQCSRSREQTLMWLD